MQCKIINALNYKQNKDIRHPSKVFYTFLEHFIRKSHQHAGIKRLSFFVVAVVTAMYVI